MSDAQTNPSLEPGEMLRLANESERAAARAMTPNSSEMYLAWGIAYVVGFVAKWLSLRPDPPVSAGFGATALAVCLMGAAVFTVWNVISRARGVGGRAAREGQRFAVAGALAFSGYGLMMFGFGTALDTTAQAGQTMELIAPVLAVFTVGATYLVGGSLEEDSVMFPTGGWLIVMAGLASLFGTPAHYLVLAIGAGGGLLAAAVMARQKRFAV